MPNHLCAYLELTKQCQTLKMVGTYCFLSIHDWSRQGSNSDRGACPYIFSNALTSTFFSVAQSITRCWKMSLISW